MISPEDLDRMKIGNEEVLLVIRGRTEEILQALGQSQFQILAAIEAGRNQIDTLEQTLKPELISIRQGLNWLMSKFEKFTKL